MVSRYYKEVHANILIQNFFLLHSNDIGRIVACVVPIARLHRIWKSQEQEQHKEMYMHLVSSTFSHPDSIPDGYFQ